MWRVTCMMMNAVFALKTHYSQHKHLLNDLLSSYLVPNWTDSLKEEFLFFPLISWCSFMFTRHSPMKDTYHTSLFNCEVKVSWYGWTKLTLQLTLQQLSEKLPQSIMYNSENTSVYLLWKCSWDQVHSAVNCSKKVTAFLKDEVSFSGIDLWGCTHRISQFIHSPDRTVTFSSKNQKLCTIRWTINNTHRENPSQNPRVTLEPAHNLIERAP